MRDNKVIPIFINFTRCLAVCTKASFCALADGSDDKMALPPKATTILRFAISLAFSSLSRNSNRLHIYPQNMGLGASPGGCDALLDR